MIRRARTRRGVRPRVRRQDGAVAVEFAFIAPILILLVFGIIFFGLALFRQQVAESATREAGRVMATGGTIAEIEAALDNAAPAFGSAELNLFRYSRDGGATWTSLQVGNVGDDTTNRADTATKPCQGADTAAIGAAAVGNRLNFTIPFWSGGTYVARFGGTAVFECEITS